MSANRSPSKGKTPLRTIIEDDEDIIEPYYDDESFFYKLFGVHRKSDLSSRQLAWIEKKNEEASKKREEEQARQERKRARQERKTPASTTHKGGKRYGKKHKKRTQKKRTQRKRTQRKRTQKKH
jgi:hypothetical protein